MGDVLRSHVQKGTDIGKAVDKFQREGRLVHDSLVSQALHSHLQELSQNHADDQKNKFGFILDGYPRTLTQAKMLTINKGDGIKSHNESRSTHNDWPDEFKISFAVNINVPNFVCIGKMKGRRKCSKCGESFNITHIETSDGFFMPRQLPDPYPCTKCDMESDWITRSDDTEEIFQRRIDEFYGQSAAVTQYYADHNRLLDFVPYKGIADMPILCDLVRNETIS